MRMRKKKNAQQRLDKCGVLCVLNPQDYKGKWKSVFANDNPVHLEIGCGKGSFVVGMAKANPNVNFIALELCRDVMVLAAEKALDQQVENVRYINGDARVLEEFLENGECDRIYLNFSDPWPKSGHKKRRLTYTSFLEIYKKVLKKGGEIHFKTDNMKLFEFSIESLSQNGWKIKNVSLDLHNSGFLGNVMTEYETRFSQMGQPIYRLEAY